MRCYNGAPDSALQALLDDSAKARSQLAEQGMRAVYFPAEQAWLVFDGLKQVVPSFFPTLRSAADAALKKGTS